MKRWLVLVLLVMCGDGAPNESVDSAAGTTQAFRTVYVAVKRIPPLTKLRKPTEYCVAKVIPAPDGPFDAVTDLEALRNRRVKETLPEGAIIRNRDLGDKEEPFWCCEPPPSHRSFDLSFTDCILPDTGIWPGLRVDLILVPYAGCEVEIANILVLGITPVQPAETPAGPVKPPQLQVAVTPADCQELALGIRSGKVIVREHKRE